MDGQLTNRLLNLGFKDEPSITRNMTNDCLFLCFVQCCKTIDSNSRKFRVTTDGKYLAQYPTHLVKPIIQREEVDISTATGMRLLAADAATYMLSEQTPNPQAPLLKRHILHRFRSAHMRNVDSEALNGEHLSDDATEDEKVDYWKKLMRLNGAIAHAYVCNHKSFHTLYNVRASDHVFTRLPAGWGDTATILVLSEVLDVDVHLYAPPDTRLASRNLPNKFRPLLFRRSTHTKPATTKLVLRYHEGHFIYMARFKQGARTGVFADHEHYLTGTHDVATGRCGHPVHPCMFLFFSHVLILQVQPCKCCIDLAVIIL
jgi:hypothetical protein